MKKRVLIITTACLLLNLALGQAQSAYFGGKGDGYAMASAGNINLSKEPTKFLSEQVTVRPNPVQSGRLIILDGLSPGNRVPFQLINGTGMVVKEGTFKPGNSPYQIGLQGIKPGIFILRVKQEYAYLHKKVLVAGN